MKKEWTFEEIEVESYAGYKGEETPRAFTYLGRRYDILEVSDLIRYTPRFQAWTLCRRVPVPGFSDN